MVAFRIRLRIWEPRDFSHREQSVLIGTPILKDSMQYEVEIKLTDKYNQEISKIIQYNLIEV